MQSPQRGSRWGKIETIRLRHVFRWTKLIGVVLVMMKVRIRKQWLSLYTAAIVLTVLMLAIVAAGAEEDLPVKSETANGPPSGLEIWVDGEHGADNNFGTQTAPLQTILAGLKKLTPGSILHVLPSASPWSGDIRITMSGTSDKPIVIDGHGSIVSNRRKIAPEEWNKVGEGVYSRKLPNNAWGMESHWEGGFPLVWFNGVAALNVSSKSNLKPGSYFLYKNRKDSKNDALHNTLFIRLPIKATLGSMNIESIVGESGIFVGGNHVIVRHFIAEYGGRDGFATHRNKGVVFENVEARYFMDQGISQHGAEVIVRNSRFHHNAGAGIVDVYPEARVRYENCNI